MTHQTEIDEAVQTGCDSVIFQTYSYILNRDKDDYFDEESDLFRILLNSLTNHNYFISNGMFEFITDIVNHLDNGSGYNYSYEVTRLLSRSHFDLFFDQFKEQWSDGFIHDLFKFKMIKGFYTDANTVFKFKPYDRDINELIYNHILNNNDNEQSLFLISFCKELEYIDPGIIDYDKLISYLIEKSIKSNHFETLLTTNKQTLKYAQKKAIIFYDIFDFNELCKLNDKNILLLSDMIEEKPALFHISPTKITDFSSIDLNIKYYGLNYVDYIFSLLEKDIYINIDQILDFVRYFNKEDDLKEIIHHHLINGSISSKNRSSYLSDLVGSHIYYHYLRKNNNPMPMIRAYDFVYFGDLLSAYLLNNTQYIAPKHRHEYEQKKETANLLELKGIDLINHFKPCEEYHIGEYDIQFGD